MGVARHLPARAVLNQAAALVGDVDGIPVVLLQHGLILGRGDVGALVVRVFERLYGLLLVSLTMDLLSSRKGS